MIDFGCALLRSQSRAEARPAGRIHRVAPACRRWGYDALMRTSLLVLLLLAAALPISAQVGSGNSNEAANREAYELKLSEPFAEHVSWVRRLDEARRRARAEEKLIFAWFTRSYEPCPACAAYERGPLVSAWWARLAPSFVPYLNVSARVDDLPDQGLLVDKGGSYFPYCILMDGRGRVLIEFRPISQRAVELAQEEGVLYARLLKAADDPKDIVAARALRLYRAIRGEIRLAAGEMETIAAEPEQDKELVARFRDYLRREEVRKAIEKAQQMVRELKRPEADDAESRRAYRARQEATLAAEIYRLLAKKVTFRIEQNPAMYFNYAILGTRGAVAAGDRATAERGLEMIRNGEETFIPKKAASPLEGVSGLGDRAAFRRKVDLAGLKAAVEALPR